MWSNEVLFSQYKSAIFTCVILTHICYPQVWKCIRDELSNHLFVSEYYFKVNSQNYQILMNDSLTLSTAGQHLWVKTGSKKIVLLFTLHAFSYCARYAFLSGETSFAGYILRHKCLWGRLYSSIGSHIAVQLFMLLVVSHYKLIEFGWPGLVITLVMN